jgi:phosphoglycerate dehydrogenase-like enzyme
MVTKARHIANAREAVRADGIQIAFVQCELGAAIRTAAGVIGPSRAARGATHRLRVVPFRLLYHDNVTARAAEPAADLPPAGIKLPLTFGAGDE